MRSHLFTSIWDGSLRTVLRMFGSLRLAKTLDAARVRLGVCTRVSLARYMHYGVFGWLYISLYLH
jgi:hypothetical protein